MPICNCESHGCVNQSLDRRAFKQHQDEDQMRWRRKAYEQYEKTVRAQDEALASEIAALTLSNVAKEPPSLSTNANGGLANPSVANTLTSKSINPYDELDQIDQLLTAMEVDIPRYLHNVGRPCCSGEVFPLKEEILRIRSLEARITRVTTTSRSLCMRRQRYAQRLQELLRHLSDVSHLWKARADEFDPPPPSAIYETGHHFQFVLDGVDPIVQISLFTIVALQVVLHLSRRGCRFLLSMIRYIIQLSFYHDRTSISDKKVEFVENFPIDPESITAKFLLDGKETIYAVCPNAKCHKNYAPTYTGRSAIPHYPKVCTYKEFKSDAPCGTALTRKQMYHETEIQVPIKIHVSFSFKDFVANLLSRPGFEDLMDNPTTSTVGGEMIDIYDAEFMHILTDATSDEPFKSSFDVGRYTFSMCMDFFNPFSNKQAGKKASIGIISVVCLSLPYTHRYKFENMFLASVIPGPKEPPLTATNHYMTPLVSDLLEFWQPGVRFSRTNKRPDGRLVQAALVLVICDLLAARKAGGFAACTHEHFCSACHCTKSLHGYGNTNCESWTRRTNADIRSASDVYRNATTAAEAQKVFDRTGVRWSELLRLPYFDPSRCVTVDSMHNLFLGLLKEHFINVLGIGLPVEREQPVLLLNLPALPKSLSENDGKGVRKLKKLLQAPSSVSLPDDRTEAISKLTSKINMKALKFVCAHVNCSIPSDSLKPTKTTVAGHLLDWRLAQPEVRQPNAETSTRKGHVLDLSDMEEIWKDLRIILTPSWTSSVPLNLGSASHGKLKADQWRTLGTLHLPLSLIRLWGSVDPSNRRSVRCHQILKVTMSLMSAVIIATSRTTSKAHAAAYLQHMREYIEGIKTLFPDYEFRPNHHMALHIHEFIVLFGPVQSWWTFPFERLIGMLQRLPHNFKIGELEATIARAHTRSANLRGLLAKAGCPEVIRNSEMVFRKLVDPQLRDSMQADIRTLEGITEDDLSAADKAANSSLKRSLSEELKSAFQRAGITSSREGYFFANTSIHGLTYSTFTKHQGNSCVFLLNSTPARIQHIIQLSSQSEALYLVIRRHKPTSRHHNPYHEYSILGADLWSAELGAIEVVSVKDVACHFACLPYDHDTVVTLPLSRSVSF